MLNKIAFLCINPLERFFLPIIQGCIRDCYQQIRSHALLREDQLYCYEKIETYGEPDISDGDGVFWKNDESMQLIYVQSSKKERIEKLFSGADLVFVGMSGNRQECDKIFLTVLPWKEKTIFLWDERFYDQKLLQQIKREYKLDDTQVLDIKKLPLHLTEALSHHFIL